jgi:Flp pilus assembly pilin Flp
MLNSLSRLQTSLRCRGASLIEYGLLAGLVSVVAIAAVSGVGLKVEGVFSKSADEMSRMAEAEPIETAPTYTSVMDYSITAGALGANLTGYLHAGSGSPMGSASVSQSSMGDLFGFYGHVNQPGQTQLYIRGDHRGLDHTKYRVVCDHGVWDLPPAAGYWADQNATNFKWDDVVDRPTFVNGATYTCSLEVEGS